MNTLFKKSFVALTCACTAITAAATDWNSRPVPTRNITPNIATTTIARERTALPQAKQLDAAGNTVAWKTIVPQSEARATTTLLAEDFSLMTAGEVGNPDMTNIIGSDGYIYYDYVNTYGWAGINVFQAGGACYLSDGTTATLNTPVLDLSGDEGNFTINLSFKAASATDRIYVIAATTTSTVDGGYITASTTDWRSVSLSFSGGATQTMIQFYSKSPVYFDDIYITQQTDTSTPTTIDAPSNLSATDITGTSFTANWNEVTTATNYLLDVFYYGTDNTKEYLLQDYETTATSHNVDGLDASHIYYFTVQATDGTLVSDESVQTIVKEPSESVGTPTAQPATEVTDNGFRANWTNAENAAWYTLYTYNYRTIAADGNYEIENESFDGFTEGTTDAPLYNGMDQILNGYTVNPDWEAVTTLYCNGMIGLKNYYKIMDVYSSLYSPVYYTSGSSMGSVTVKVTAYRDADCSNFTEIGVGCIDATTQTPTWKSATLSTSPQEYEFTFDAHEVYYLAIQFNDPNNADYGQTGIVWIDNVTVTQQFSAGDLFSRMYSCDNVYSGNSFYVATPADNNDSYSYFVIANTNGANGSIYSDPSNEVEVQRPSSGTSIVVAGTDGANIRGIQGAAEITLDQDARIDVYNTCGALAASITGNKGLNSISLPAGFYIIKAGTTTAKVIVK